MKQTLHVLTLGGFIDDAAMEEVEDDLDEELDDGNED